MRLTPEIYFSDAAGEKTLKAKIYDEKMCSYIFSWIIQAEKVPINMGLVFIISQASSSSLMYKGEKSFCRGNEEKRGKI